MTKICVPVCVDRVEEMREAVERASQVADIVELRLDYLNNLAASCLTLHELINETRCPLILTLRSAAQGGRNSFDYDCRRRFWLSLKNIPAETLCDLEYDLVREFSASATHELPFSWQQVICSHHDFRGVPSDLERIYERLAATPAAIINDARAWSFTRLVSDLRFI